jgi:hypothetical protein
VLLDVAVAELLPHTDVAERHHLHAHRVGVSDF